MDFKLSFLAAWCVSLAGCASMVSDNVSRTLIESRPEAARCDLYGHGFNRSVDTPVSLQLPASAAPITVVCQADGHRLASILLDSETDGWIFGNILIGGGIGILVDGARGAGQKYPPTVLIILEPSSFDSFAARDAWFDRRRAAVEATWSKALADLREQCRGADMPGTCTDDIEAANTRLQKELEEIDRKRKDALVEPPSLQSRAGSPD